MNSQLLNTHTHTQKVKHQTCIKFKNKIWHFVDVYP